MHTTRMLSGSAARAVATCLFGGWESPGIHAAAQRLNGGRSSSSLHARGIPLHRACSITCSFLQQNPPSTISSPQMHLGLVCAHSDWLELGDGGCHRHKRCLRVHGAVTPVVGPLWPAHPRLLVWLPLRGHAVAERRRGLAVRCLLGSSGRGGAAASRRLGHRRCGGVWLRAYRLLMSCSVAAETSEKRRSKVEQALLD